MFSFDINEKACLYNSVINWPNHSKSRFAFTLSILSLLQTSSKAYCFLRIYDRVSSFALSVSTFRRKSVFSYDHHISICVYVLISILTANCLYILALTASRLIKWFTNQHLDVNQFFRTNIIFQFAPTIWLES